MRALVVYESMFGNTRIVAEAIARGLAADMEVSLHEVSSAPRRLPTDIDLLVVGGPTHAFSMSRVSTRADAATKSDRPIESIGIGVREWIEQLPRSDGSLPVATFDTKVAHPRLPGSAAHAADKRLRRHGYQPIRRPETFLVDGLTGPLLAGEVERATGWAAGVAASAARLFVAG